MLSDTEKGIKQIMKITEEKSTTQEYILIYKFQTIYLNGTKDIAIKTKYYITLIGKIQLV